MGREYSKVFSAKVAQAGGLRFWQAISLRHGSKSAFYTGQADARNDQ